MKRCIWISLALIASFFANSALAGSYTSCWGKKDYSDAGVNSAGNSYDTACHQTDSWQSLGDDWDKERRYNATTVGHDDATDDGVTWRTSSDGGVTWTEFSTDNVLTQGDLVEFKFEFNRSVSGYHQFDELKAWIDWDQQNGWDNTQNWNGVDGWSGIQSNGEIIADVLWYKDQNAQDEVLTINESNPTEQTCNDAGLTWNGDTKTCNSTDNYRVYTQQIEIPLDATVGTTWMRVRVTCENSLNTYSTQKVMEPYGYLHQGEVEDYMITIAAKTDTPVSVPEPSGLLLMSSALFFLATRRRNRKKHNREI